MHHAVSSAQTLKNSRCTDEAWPTSRSWKFDVLNLNSRSVEPSVSCWRKLLKLLGRSVNQQRAERSSQWLTALQPAESSQSAKWSDSFRSRFRPPLLLLLHRLVSVFVRRFDELLPGANCCLTRLPLEASIVCRDLHCCSLKAIISAKLSRKLNLANTSNWKFYGCNPNPRQLLFSQICCWKQKNKSQGVFDVAGFSGGEATSRNQLCSLRSPCDWLPWFSYLHGV